MLAHAEDAAQTALRPEIQSFIREMAAEHGFDQARLTEQFARIRRRDDIIALITRPAERTKPWHEYRAIFLDRQRIENGAAFWREHATTLARAEQTYGVPPEIVTAIIGVETRYGRVTGRDGVLEALTTLAFDYPRRADFFRRELEEYLLLTREEGIDPLSLLGSYAGAMGIAQFMPSSYRAYAVDFDDDGLRDLWHNPVDAIGSAASYLGEHGWRAGAPVVAAAEVSGSAWRAQLDQGMEPRLTVAEWRALGVRPEVPVDDARRAILLELEGADGPIYRLGFHNFYVITRYNRSPLYAMAVFELAQAIRARRVAGS
ncbi:MAG: lytic murein transglycosylase B [Candidatus Competibacterales bacterium]|nr:lytic murein transglycosylase B [Candidatus Competibacterales bacterium]